ncbi:MAG TPA: hypothetical protein PLT06_09985, partial [Syntrophorhabdaceae bacterium]|nr:hypothetical protein [Syntrophorhabdaceae bacterium]
MLLRYPGPWALYTLGIFIRVKGSIRLKCCDGDEASAWADPIVSPLIVSAGDSRRRCRVFDARA